MIDSSRGKRGGEWDFPYVGLLARIREKSYPTHEYYDTGFRVAGVPEPASITLMLCGAIAGLLWWRRQRRT